MDEAYFVKADKLLFYLLYIIGMNMDSSSPVYTPDGFCSYITITPATFLFDRDDLSVIKNMSCSGNAEIDYLVQIIESCLKGVQNG